MKLAIFGATGQTGLILSEKALELGHELKALVRTPSKLGELQSKVQIIEGSLEDKDKVQKTLEGCDAVINVSGHAKNSPKNVSTLAAQNIIEGMNIYGVKRLITLTGQGVFAEGDNPKLFDKFITFMLKLIDPKRLSDGEDSVALIRASNLDWTIVRVPMLQNTQSTGNYHIGMVGDKNMDFKISRGDVSDFILSILNNSDYIKKLPAIASKK